MFSLFQINIYK